MCFVTNSLGVKLWRPRCRKKGCFRHETSTKLRQQASIFDKLSTKLRQNFDTKLRTSTNFRQNFDKTSTKLRDSTTLRQNLDPRLRSTALDPRPWIQGLRSEALDPRPKGQGPRFDKHSTKLRRNTGGHEDRKVSITLHQTYLCSPTALHMPPQKGHTGSSVFNPRELK